MAWTTARTWVTDEIVTDTLFNAHVRDNLSAVKSDADLLDTLSLVTSPTRVLATNYQNSNGNKTMFVRAYVYGAAVNLDAAAYIGSASPAGTLVVNRQLIPCPTTLGQIAVTFQVPPSWYYRLDSANGTLRDWVEHLIH